MKLTHAYSALVNPLTAVDTQSTITGAAITPQGELGEMLYDVFERATSECDMAIIFLPDAQGNQNNECRDLLMEHIRQPTDHTGEAIALRLQSVTPSTAGSALLFILAGVNDQGYHRLVVSRFPAEVGVLAQETNQSLSLEFIEQVFLKNAHAYKCACFETEHPYANFPGGRSTDRQARGNVVIAGYWLAKFLQSQLKLTDVHGTQFFAKAMKEAANAEDDPEVKQEIVAATVLTRGMDGQTHSTESLLSSLPLTPPAVQRITSKLPRPEVARDAFTFSREEYDKIIRYETVDLNNGATLTAEHGEFANVFHQEPVDDNGLTRYSTEGKVVQRRFRNAK